MIPHVKPSAEEIQLVHDKLVAIALGEIDLGFSAQQKIEITVAASVLCWILGHDHNTAFSEAMKSVDRRIEELGMVVEQVRTE